MLPLRVSKIRMFLMCLMLAGTIMLHKSGESIERYLLVTEDNQNSNRWQNQDRVDTMVKELSQFDPTTVIFPEELKHTFSTKYANKRPFLSLPHKGMDPNPQAHIESMAEGDLRHFLYGCSATSGVQINTSSTPWIMTSLDLEGDSKTHGGDEFYVSYKLDNDSEPAHSSDAIARVVDRADGTYELYFLQSRSPRRNPDPRWWGVGELTVHLLYTCATSLLDPPEKTNWKSDGFIDTIWTDAGIPPPSFGRFKTEPRRFPELVTEYDYVYAVGNSLMKNFAWKCYSNGGICRPPIKLGDCFRDNIVYSNGLGAPLNSRTVHTHFLPRIERGVQEQRETESLIGAIQEDRSAFILGSCVWDLTAMYDLESYDQYGNNHKFGFYELEDHLEAIRFFISEIRRLHPLRQIYWKGCTALHRQVFSTVPSTPDILASLMYTSLIRGRHLDAAQKEILGELNVTVIDMFDMTYEMPELHRSRDTKHYNPEMALYWADYFLPKGDGIATASA